MFGMKQAAKQGLRILIVGCGNDSALEILELTPSGGKRMTAAAFRNGLRNTLPEFITELEI